MTTPIRHGGQVQTAQPMQPPMTPRTDTAQQTGTTSLHNVHQGPKAEDATANMVRAVRSNGVSRAKAANALGNLPIGPAIRSDKPVASPRTAMTDRTATHTLSRQMTGGASAAQSATASASVDAKSGAKSARDAERAQMKSVLEDLSKLMNRDKDKETGAPLSNTLYFSKGDNGQVHFIKLPVAKDTKAAQEKYMKSESAGQARELAGQKLADLFTKAGLQLTDEIRLALPSKSHMGDAKVIKDTLVDAELKLNHLENAKARELPATMAQTLAALKTDLANLDWNNVKSVENLFRGNTKSSRLMVGLLGEAFTKGAKQCAATAVKAGYDCLYQTKSPDLAAVALHQALLGSLKDIHFTPEVYELAQGMMKLADEVAAEKMQSNSDPSVKKKFDQATVDKIALKGKEKMLATIMLRTLMNQISEELTEMDNTYQREAGRVSGQPPADELRFARIGDKLMKLVNGTMESAQSKTQIENMTAKLPAYATFLANKDQNNLKAFIALRQLEEAVKPQS